MKRILLITAITTLLCSSVFAQSNWTGWFVGGSAAFSRDGDSQKIKNNFAPQFSAIVKLGGDETNTYYMPGLTWKTESGWLQVEALSIYTQIATLNFGALFIGGSASPLVYSTSGGVKREDVGIGGIDVGVTVPLNRKADKLYLALALKYAATVSYDSQVPESDRVDNAIILSAGIIGLNPFK